MGFHTSFYHSWRGDSNDEAGFGTDIRVVRGILKILKDANDRGLDARGYWDIDGYYTFERIIPENAPDIIEGIRERVKAGLDEVLPAPYNNGLVSAHTPYEMHRAVAWTAKNPWGSGLDQVFGAHTPIFRPQESVTTTGMIPILKRAGIEGMILPYSPLPFTSIAAFVPPLAPEERFGTYWLKHPTGPEKLAVIPCYNPADALDYGSFELWLLKLRKLQTSGKVKADLAIHYNFDADAETWLPMKQLPLGLSGLPNTRGLYEIIGAVNKYQWAAFTTPGEFLRSHPPKKEVLVRRDTADGAFDGYYSWAEKHQSHKVWTNIEQSRMYSYRADALTKGSSDNTAGDIREKLWADRDSSFWYRLLAMSTTHFGMSTPILNEERQAKADSISEKARDIAYNAYRKATETVKTQPNPEGKPQYVVTVFNYPRSKDGKGNPNRAPVRVPVIFNGLTVPRVTGVGGGKVPASIIDVTQIDDGISAGEVTFVVSMDASKSKTYSIRLDPAKAGDRSTGKVKSLDNGSVSLLLSESSGIEKLRYKDLDYGKVGFLDPFITYKTRKKTVTYGVSKWELPPLENEVHRGLERSRLVARVPVKTPTGTYTAKFTYTFTLYNDLPYLFVDVYADYPYIPPRDLIQTVSQKLRRLLDLRWIEVGSFQIRPDISAPENDPITIWKHNYLDIVSSYRLDYGRINPKNRQLDSFNHQVTNGWVAMENGKKGLLIAQSAETNALFAFTPMRLRTSKDGMQRLLINPFGTYFGRQLDYSHTGSNGAGALMTTAVGAHLRPSGPSWNGKIDRFSLMLAPYGGGKPPENRQNDAMAFFYPYGVIYNRSPLGDEIFTAEDARGLVERKLREVKMADPSPLPIPGALLANPAENAIALVWDAPRDVRITGFEVRWKSAGSDKWHNVQAGAAARANISGVEDGKTYVFSVRSLSGARTGDWTTEIEGIPGKVEGVDYSHESKNIPLKLIRKLLTGILKHKILVR